MDLDSDAVADWQSSSVAAAVTLAEVSRRMKR